MLDLVVCPEPACYQPASIRNKSFLESTHGPVEHAQVGCVQRHVFLMPTEALIPL